MGDRAELFGGGWRWAPHLHMLGLAGGDGHGGHCLRGCTHVCTCIHALAHICTRTGHHAVAGCTSADAVGTVPGMDLPQADMLCLGTWGRHGVSLGKRCPMGWMEGGSLAWPQLGAVWSPAQKQVLPGIRLCRVFLFSTPILLGTPRPCSSPMAAGTKGPEGAGSHGHGEHRAGWWAAGPYPSPAGASVQPPAAT